MNVKAKKSLGQNFLKAKWALILMTKAAKVGKKDIILEAGPGKGALTEKLLEAGAKVIAVEKDRRLIPELEKKFSKEIKSGRLRIIEGDILNFNPANYGLQTTNYKLISNIPYYITGSFLEKFLSAEIQPEKMVLTVQKEVAKRITASSGKESVLSISVKAYGKPEYIKAVGKEFFSPKPKVDSAIILIDNISKERFGKSDEKLFFKIMKTGFSHKRKFLLGNLKGKEFEADEKLFKNLGINPKARAEDLTLGKWLALAKSLE